MSGDQNMNHFYRLKVNINGFKLEEISVTLDEVPKSNGNKENSKARVN